MGAPERTLLLTGAGGRLGVELCRNLADTWLIAAVHGKRPPPAFENVVPIQADLGKPGEIERAVDEALAKVGPIDALVNNAVMYALAPLFEPRTLQTAEEQLRVNLLAPLRLTARLADKCWRGKQVESRVRNRSIVNVSSLSGQKIYANQKQGLYSASKAALDMLTRHMAAELRPLGLRVNGIAPNAFPAVVSTEEVALEVVNLLDNQATGQLVVIDRVPVRR